MQKKREICNLKNLPPSFKNKCKGLLYNITLYLIILRIEYVLMYRSLRIIWLQVISFQPFPHTTFLCFSQIHFIFLVSFFKSFTEISQNFYNDIQYRNVSMDQYIYIFYFTLEYLGFIGPSSILFLLIFIADGKFPERITF